MNSRRSTARQYDASPARLRVWQGIFEEILAEKVPCEGRAAVVTAGPPGAGKTTKLEAALSGELAGWRRLDGDVIKEHLIRRALVDGLYDDLLEKKLPDHRVLMPLELAGLVHDESMVMVSDLRRRCMQRGENVIIEGTLAWQGQVDVHLHEVAQHDYDALDILVVDADRAVAVERALSRWWSGRTDPDSELGGRFVPESAIARCYGERGMSVCRENAEELLRKARQLPGLQVRMLDPDATTAGSLRVIADER